MRLAEAELLEAGFRRNCVHGSVATNSRDGGVDVFVDVPTQELETGYLRRPKTIFQVKLGKMPPSRIEDEMMLNGKLRDAISEHASIGGSYIIVSLADKCTLHWKNKRVEKMRELLAEESKSIHVDFYDQSKLLNWIRSHRHVLIWVKNTLGVRRFGWKSYGNWSQQPIGSDNSMLLSPGVSVTLPKSENKISLKDAINPMRDIIRNSKKSTRIIGLSGIGKTRIVQSLFENNIGKNSLDFRDVLYLDVGTNTSASPSEMIDELSAMNQLAIVVVDNCPSNLHSDLTRATLSAAEHISLITIEYDIRDDNPQVTDVVQIEANDTDMPYELILRTFPEIGHDNAERIAALSGGNARLALILAEKALDGHNPAHLSDATFFDRLFLQRNKVDENFKICASALSLVYSFSEKVDENGVDELASLGSLLNRDRNEMYSAARRMISRGLAKRRSTMTAVLPHALATVLSINTLENIPTETLNNVFFIKKNRRLLTSLSRRLRIMHDSIEAQKLVRSWIAVDGPLGRLENLDDEDFKIFKNIAPVVPDDIIERIDDYICIFFSEPPTPRDYARVYSDISSILISIAYDEKSFSRSVSTLCKIAKVFNDAEKSYAEQHILQFFQPYFSRTTATIQQRLNVILNNILSSDKFYKDLGLRMLSTALEEPIAFFVGKRSFGARLRDPKMGISQRKLAKWRQKFIKLALEISFRKDHDLTQSVMKVVGENFHTLWKEKGNRADIVKAVKSMFAKNGFCIELWIGVRKTIFEEFGKTDINHLDQKVPRVLIDLESRIAPDSFIDVFDSVTTGDLKGDYMTYTIPNGVVTRSEHPDDEILEMSENLGRRCAQSLSLFPMVVQRLQSVKNCDAQLKAFGYGLAAGSESYGEIWKHILGKLDNADLISFSYNLVSGFLSAVNDDDTCYANKLIDDIIFDTKLQRHTPMLYPLRSLDREDYDRLKNLLKCRESRIQVFGLALRAISNGHSVFHKFLEVGKELLQDDGGEDVILTKLGSYVRGSCTNFEPLSKEIGTIGLAAIVKKFDRVPSTGGDSTDREFELCARDVLGYILKHNFSEKSRKKLINSIFNAIDRTHGSIIALALIVVDIAATFPNEFLSEIFHPSKSSSMPHRFKFVQSGPMYPPSLGLVCVDFLIDWCQKQTDESYWTSVASSIDCWVWFIDGPIGEFSKKSVKFLNAAPNPEDVLWAFLNSRDRILRNGYYFCADESLLSEVLLLAERVEPTVRPSMISVAKVMIKNIERDQEARQGHFDLDLYKFE